MSTILDLTVLSPLVNSFIEFGLNLETTIGGVTAPPRDLMSPDSLFWYTLMWHLIDICSISGTIASISYYIKNNKSL
ncbi:MAG: hypothetical protein GF311_06385 [Candidatus Lokiarchaeota archaeon]|nr:hypothetical protein [Candidatus Lokiarchaeota archaeon]